MNLSSLVIEYCELKLNELRSIVAGYLYNTHCLPIYKTDLCNLLHGLTFSFLDLHNQNGVGHWVEI